MPTVAIQAQEHQDRWDELVRDPSLRDLPYKVETNSRGQIVLTPHKAEHSDLQEDIQNLLRTYAPGGRQPPEYPITTSDGVKKADVVWMSSERRAEMRKTGDPPTLAPEICVEVLSPNNRWANIKEKIDLYREAGAEEVWVVDTERRVRFFGAEEMEASAFVPDAPKEL
jgi:Uma2 family endonuclease